ncbi:hypothetical protein GY45DRAFT_1370827 [Cubamyces sp. BRFM 1775]|nr:hypothetical protein GY45DRAFT_1370827 [Cubamyces sp. BRFM 1775]
MTLRTLRNSRILYTVRAPTRPRLTGTSTGQSTSIATTTTTTSGASKGTPLEGNPGTAPSSDPEAAAAATSASPAALQKPDSVPANSQEAPLEDPTAGGTSSKTPGDTLSTADATSTTPLPKGSSPDVKAEQPGAQGVTVKGETSAGGVLPGASTSDAKGEKGKAASENVPSSTTPATGDAATSASPSLSTKLDSERSEPAADKDLPPPPPPKEQDGADGASVPKVTTGPTITLPAEMLEDNPWDLDI